MGGFVFLTSDMDKALQVEFMNNWENTCSKILELVRFSFQGSTLSSCFLINRQSRHTRTTHTQDGITTTPFCKILNPQPLKDIVLLSLFFFKIHLIFFSAFFSKHIFHFLLFSLRTYMYIHSRYPESSF